MPGFDGTGPRGLGPMTGGGRGFCAVPRSRLNAINRGRRVLGRYGPGYPYLSADEELELLKGDLDLLQKELESIESRIKNIEK
jgi:hypothetical protein